ncbi:MAG: toll/interleukin-1 receptor domain-containing protein [Lachnospiraceae bacterium]|nr:toll/interleukin-1 receptor domain-containing protein [Lachnospiraceae bacterium]
MEEHREYVAFISYRHKDLDKQIAKKVHTMLERYHVPKEMQKDGIGPRLGRVFRDEEELPVSSDLTASIQTALDHSKFLLVVCTPDTPESIWVEQEIKYFVEKHGREHVIGILVNGTPEESFPVPLTTDFAEDGKTVVHITEPLAANLTDVNHRYDAKRFKKEIMRLYAAILGCPFDSLWQRERRHKQRVVITALSAATCGLVAFSSYVYLKNKEITRQNEQILAQNEQISRQNEEIQEQNSELKRRESEALIREGSALIDSGNSRKAVDRLVQALASEEGRKNYSGDGYELLQEALAAGQYSDKIRTVVRITQDNEIQEIKLSETGEYLFTRDYLGLVRCYRTKDGGLLWKADTMSGQVSYDAVSRDRMAFVEHSTVDGTGTGEEAPADTDRLLCMNGNGIMAFSVEDGSLLWRHEVKDLKILFHNPGQVDFSCLSADGQRLALMEAFGEDEYQSAWGKDYYDQGGYVLTVLNTSDGSVEQQIPMPQEIQALVSGKAYAQSVGSQVGAFSEDGNFVVGGVYGYDMDQDYDNRMYYFVADLQAGETRLIHSESAVWYANGEAWAQYLLGFYVDPGQKRTLVFHYDGGEQELRMDEIFWDGRLGECTAMTKELPMRVSGKSEWHSTFSTEHPTAITATFCNTRLVFIKQDGKLAGNEDYSNSIMGVQYLSEGDWSVWTYGLLTDEGVLHCRYEGGFEAGPFCDKQHFALFDVTDGYVSSHCDFGYTMNPDAVAAVVCDDDYNTVYLMVPESDSHVEIAAWSIDEEAQNFRTYPVKDGMLAFCVLTKDEAVIRIVDLGSDEVKKEYRFALEDYGELRSLIYGTDQFLFYPDGSHLAYIDTVSSLTRDVVKVLNLESRQWERIYGGEVVERPENPVAVYSGVVTRDGDVIHASLDSNLPQDTVTWKQQLNQLCYKKNEESVQVVACETGKFWGSNGFRDGTPYLKVGENGMILVGQYGDAEQELMESFFVYDTKSGNSCTISDACPQNADRNIVLGNKDLVFAALDSDDKLRIYDMQTQEVKQTITLEGGIERVKEIAFCNQDQAVCVYEKDHYKIYDLNSGALVYEESIQGINYMSKDYLYTIDDPGRNRTYLCFPSGAALCVDTALWRKIHYYDQLGAFDEATNTVYALNRGMSSVGETQGVWRIPAYTLDDLIVWGKEW